MDEKKRHDEILKILETLTLWGVRTFRDFASLPVAGISERLGQEGIRLQQLASGKTERHLKLKQPAPVFENSIELEHALAELEPLSFIFARLLNQLCASLNAYALATNELRVRMKLEDETSHERRLNLPSPMRDPKVFLKLLLLDTEMHPPQVAVIGVTIACEPVKPRVLQNGLFIPLAPQPEKLELTLARLAKLVGPENTGSPELVDTHRPGAFRMKRFGLKEKVNPGDRKIRNPKSEIRNVFWGSEFFARLCERWLRPTEVIPHRSTPGDRIEVCMGKWCGWVVHGGRQVIGGAKIVGREMNGMSPWKSVQRVRPSPPLRPCKSFIEFIAN